MTEAPASAGYIQRALLRHTIATLAYRASKAVRDAPATFATFDVGNAARRPVQILAHMGDLMDWGLSLAKGSQVWRPAEPLPWDREVERFFAALARLDAYLVSDAPLGGSAEQLFQGPIADALTHVGQLAMLRRLAESPVRAENYAKAEIMAGQVGRAQPKPRVEFD